MTYLSHNCLEIWGATPFLASNIITGALFYQMVVNLAIR
jgi:hypothetical protein